MEIEIEEHVGAGRHERAETRTGHRNGYRKRTWDTRVGTVELDVPRVRDAVATSPLSWTRGGGPSGP